MFPSMGTWSMLVSLIFISLFSSSPHMSVLLLIASSFFLGMLFLYNYMSWVFYSVVILFLGGMMVLFVYICCITPFTKMKTNNLYLLLMVPVLCLSVSSMKDLNMHPLFVGSIFLKYSASVLILLMVYLLVGLVVSVKISSKFDGPLKSNERTKGIGFN